MGGRSLLSHCIQGLTDACFVPFRPVGRPVQARSGQFGPVRACCGPFRPVLSCYSRPLRCRAAGWRARRLSPLIAQRHAQFAVQVELFAQPLQQAGIEVETVRKLQEGRPNLLDHMANGQVQIIFNTPSGKGARSDEGRIRASAVIQGVPCVTTLPGCHAMVKAIEYQIAHPQPQVQALQTWAKSLK